MWSEPAAILPDILLYRPGALGDVVVLRAVIGTLRTTFPAIRIAVLVPGAKGKLLERLGDNIRTLDSDLADMAWLHGDGTADVPPRLDEFVKHAAIAVAYLNDEAGRVTRNLKRLGVGDVFVHPARPAENGSVHVHAHLLRPFAGTVLSGDAASSDALTAALPCFRFSAEEKARARQTAGVTEGAFAVLHPGSGSARKNWPHFADLAQYLSRRLPVVVTTSEEDGALRELASRVTERNRGVPEAKRVVPLHNPRLDELGALLSEAELYVGNDSGVTHLAAASNAKRRVSLFGPTRPEVWAEPGDEVICADHLPRLPAEYVIRHLDGLP